MALQASAGLRSTPPLSLPLHSTGLRRPSDRYALKSAFFSPSVNLILSPSQRAPPATAPKFSMRLASKQAYICRDCGFLIYPAYLDSVSVNLYLSMHVDMPLFVAAVISTMRGHHLRSSLTSISALVRSKC